MDFRFLTKSGWGMKHMAVAAVWVFTAASAYAQGIGGFDGLRWKMTRQEVQAEYPNFETWPGFDDNLNAVINYGLRDHTTAFCPFQVKLDFIDNRLFQVAMEQIPSDHTECRKSVSDELMKTYGKPTTSGPFGMQWKSGPTTVVYREDKLASEVHVAVIYTDDAALNSLLQNVQKDHL